MNADGINTAREGNIRSKTMANLTRQDHATRHYTEVIRGALRSYLSTSKPGDLECEEIQDAFYKLTGFHVDPRED